MVGTMTDNTRKLLDAAAAVLGLPPGLPPIGERRCVLNEVREVTGYDRHSTGDVWVMWSSVSDNGQTMPVCWYTWPLADAQPAPSPADPPDYVGQERSMRDSRGIYVARCTSVRRSERDGKVWVQWDNVSSTLAPGGGRMLDGAPLCGTCLESEWLKWPPHPAPGADDLPRVVEWADLQPGDLAFDVRAKHGPMWHGGKGKGGSWRDEDGTRRSGSRDGIGRKYANSAQAVLIARNVPKRASAIRAAYEAMRERALEVGESIPRRGT